METLIALSPNNRKHKYSANPSHWRVALNLSGCSLFNQRNFAGQ